MRREDISNAVGNISARHIQEAMPARAVRKKVHWARWGTLAACLCIVTIGIGALLSADRASGLPNKPSVAPPVVSPTQSVQPETGSVYYSQLQLPKGRADADMFAAFSEMAVDLVAFDESMLSQCSAILEGEITNMYLKSYSYAVADDKFGADTPLNYDTKTIVYEMRIDHTWYGDDNTGDTILIEDQIIFPDETFALKVGHKYVIPIYEVGEAIEPHSAQVVSGNITRDSALSTVYPFHPQIEVTQDGGYVVSTDWATLSAAQGREIIVDVDMSEYGEFYKDKLMLLTRDAFSAQMRALMGELF